MGWGPLVYVSNFSSDLTWLCSEKISRHIPTLSVYSKEMSEKIELEAEKLRSANSVDYSKVDKLTNVVYMTDCVEIFWSGPLSRDKRTNSTLLLKQPNSLEVDRAALRKTRSEENMGSVAPKIIIGNPPPLPATVFTLLL